MPRRRPGRIFGGRNETYPMGGDCAVGHDPASCTGRICYAARRLRCGRMGEWENAFSPGRVIPKKTDKCPADLKKPVFTREGTLACPSEDAYGQAADAMRHGWKRMQPWSSVPHGRYSKHKPLQVEWVSAQTFGCTIYHDGTAVTITGTSFALAATNLGVLHKNNLRN